MTAALFAWMRWQRARRIRLLSAYQEATQGAVLAAAHASFTGGRLVAGESTVALRREPFDTILSEDDFRAHFRFSRKAFAELLSMVQRSWAATIRLGRAGRPASFTCRDALLLLLYRATSNEPVHRIASRFGIGKSSVVRQTRCAIAAVRDALADELHWPTPVEQLRVMKDFVDRAERKGERPLPGVCGIVDGTHIVLRRAPAVDARSFINRKKRYSLNLQAVCDSNGRFMHVTIGWPGSVNDARVFTNSEVPSLIEEWPHGRIIIADGGYALSARCMTPYRAPSTQLQRGFNDALSGQRGAIERAFGRLKARFRRLQQLDTTTGADTIGMIAVCFLLHNFAERRGDEWHVSDADYLAFVLQAEDVVYEGATPDAAKLARDRIATDIAKELL